MVILHTEAESVWKYIVEELDTLYNQGKTDAPTIIASIFLQLQHLLI